MRRILSFALFLLAFPAYDIAQTGVLFGPGSPNAQSPVPDCSNRKVYVDVTTGKLYTARAYPCVWAEAATAVNLSGGAVGSIPYQSAASTSLFVASPTTANHTFFMGWKPAGAVIAPAAFDLGALTGAVNIVTATTTVTTAAPGPVRAIIGQATTSNASYANGTDSLAGVRGLVTIPGTTTASAGFLYGSQGKLIADGATIAIGSGHAAGLYGQLSANGTTATSGHIAIGILSGQNLPASSNIDGLYLESGGNAINSVIKGIFNANYVIDLAKESGPAYAQTPTISGDGPCAAVPGTAVKALAIKIDGVNYWIPLCGAL